MRKTTILSFLAVCVFVILAVVSCKDDKYDGVASKISVAYPSQTFVVDLNAAKYPPIVCVVTSEIPLQSVATYIVKEGGQQVELGRVATSFFNPKNYSVNITPVYSEDMRQFRVVAKDSKGTEMVSDLPLQIIPLRDAPTVQFNGGQAEITYKEGDPMPAITISAQSDDDLNYVVLSEVVGNLESVVTVSGADTVRFGEGVKNYTYDLATDGFQFKFNTTALRLTATAGMAGRPKSRVATLKVNYIEAPAPVTAFDGGQTPIDVKEFEDVTVSGTVSSESPLISVKYLLQITGREDSLLSEVTELANPYAFSHKVTRIAAGTTGFIVEATNDMGKVSRSVKPLQVEELAPAPVIMLDQAEGAFLAVDKDADLALTGHIEAPGGLKKFTLYKKMMDGTESEVNLLSAEGVTVEPVDKTVKADETLLGLRLEAVDVNGKSHTLSYDVTVGYHYYYVEASVVGPSSSSRETSPGFFFDATHGRVYGKYCDAKDNADYVNVAFTSASANKTINVDKIHYYDKLSVSGSPASCASVTKKDGIVTPLWGTAYQLRIADIKRSGFDQATISMIQAEALPDSDSPVRVTLAQNGFDNPTENVCLYAIEVDGVKKRVLICFDKVTDESQVGSATATFWIKVKVEK